jgi:transcriptional regulator with XRE-family HTH domain
LLFSPSDHPLRRARQQAGYSLRSLGRVSRVHYSRISLIEHGLLPREDELLRLAGVLGCRPESLQLDRRPAEAREMANA